MLVMGGDQAVRFAANEHATTAPWVNPLPMHHKGQRIETVRVPYLDADGCNPAAGSVGAVVWQASHRPCGSCSTGGQ